MIRRAFLFALVLVSAFTVCAGDPTPESETDLPTNVTAAVNGTKLQEGLSDLVYTAADAMTVTFLSSKEKICKKCFFYAAAKLLEVVDDERLTDLFAKLGYTIWTGSGDDREIYIRGFFNEETTLTPNDVIDTLCEVLCPRIDDTITEKTTYSKKYSLEVCAADDDWDESFDIDYKILGIKLFDADYSVDRGDAYAVIGALRAVEGILYFLRGQDLSAVTIPELLGIIGDFAAMESPSVEEVFGKISDILKKLSVRSTADLTASRTYLGGVMVDSLAAGDSWIRNTRKDAVAHLIGRASESDDGPGHAISYDPAQPVIALIRDHASVIKDMINKSGSNAPLIQKSWFEGLFTIPAWIERDEYRVSLSPLFTEVRWAEKLPVFEGDWVKSVPDPTFAGILPDLTAAETEKMMVALSISGFDDPAIEANVTTETYGEFQAWAANFSGSELRHAPRAFQSYAMRTVVEPYIFAEEPKIEIGELTVDGSGPRMTVRVTDGETLVRAAKAIEEKVQVCTDLGKGSWQKATATATERPRSRSARRTATAVSCA